MEWLIIKGTAQIGMLGMIKMKIFAKLMRLHRTARCVTQIVQRTMKTSNTIGRKSAKQSHSSKKDMISHANLTRINFLYNNCLSIIDPTLSL